MRPVNQLEGKCQVRFFNPFQSLSNGGFPPSRQGFWWRFVAHTVDADDYLRHACPICSTSDLRLDPVREPKTFETGVFGIYVGTDRKNITRSIKLIKAELGRFREERISQEELDRTKMQLKGNLMLGLENTASRMNRLAKMEIYLDSYYSLDQTIAEIDKVQASDILRVANELLHEELLHTTILKPGKV